MRLYEIMPRAMGYLVTNVFSCCHSSEEAISLRTHIVWLKIAHKTSKRPGVPD